MLTPAADNRSARPVRVSGAAYSQRRVPYRAPVHDARTRRHPGGGRWTTPTIPTNPAVQPGRGRAVPPPDGRPASTGRHCRGGPLPRVASPAPPPISPQFLRNTASSRVGQVGVAGQCPDPTGVSMSKSPGLTRRTIAPLRPLAKRRPTADPVALADGSSAIVNCGLYVDGYRVAFDGDFREAARRARELDGFVWMGLHEPSADQLTELAGEFDLHPLAVEDAVHAHQRPKLDRYDDTLFVVLKTVQYVEHEHLTATSEIVQTGEVMVFVGAHFAITVRHGEHGGLAAHCARQLEDRARAAAPRPVGGAARDRRPRGRRLPVGRRRDRDRRRRGRDARCSRPGAPRTSSGSTSSSASCSSCAVPCCRWRPRCAAGRAAPAGGAARDPGVLPRRRRPPTSGCASRSAASTSC